MTPSASRIMNQEWPKAQGLRQKANKSNWAKGKDVILGTTLDLLKLALKTSSGQSRYHKS